MVHTSQCAHATFITSYQVSVDVAKQSIRFGVQDVTSWAACPRPLGKESDSRGSPPYSDWLRVCVLMTDTVNGIRKYI